MTAEPEYVRSVLRIRDFRFYLLGAALTQIGSNGALTAMLYHVYVLSGSVVQVGVVGAARGVAIIAFSPLSGHLADRFDRKRLLQLSQALAFAVGAGLTLDTVLGSVVSWHIWLATLLTSIAAAIDQPVRKALLNDLMPPGTIVAAVSMNNPVNQVSRLIGPGLAGLLIAWRGPELMYGLDALMCATLILIVVALGPVRAGGAGRDLRLWSGIREGVAFVARRPIIYHLWALDLAALLFTGYRVVLPVIALDVLKIGPAGYGFLSAAVPAGGFVGGFLAFRLARNPLWTGRLVLATTAGYGLAAVALAVAASVPVAASAALCLGLFDAVGTTFRQAAVMVETPAMLQGRVQSLYQMSATGGPAVGEFSVGWIAGAIGPALSLAAGGLAAVAYVAVVAWRAPVVRRYRTDGRVGPPAA